MRNAYIVVILICFLSCSLENQDVQTSLEMSQANKQELIKVLEHYKSDTSCRLVAEFLIGNIYDKYYIDGPSLRQFDAYFEGMAHLRESGVTSEDDSRVHALWDSVQATVRYEPKSDINKVWDCQNLSAEYLIENIDVAWASRQHTPEYCDKSIETFLEYILPYRVGHEPPTYGRQKYAEKYHILRDTATTVRNFLWGFTTEFRQKQGYRGGLLLMRYPGEISMVQLEKVRLATCKQNAMLCATIMRSLGIPVAVDHAPAWGNRYPGHTWNALLLETGGIYPFNPLSYEKIKFESKPAKILRTVFSAPQVEDAESLSCDVPVNLWMEDVIDVTDQYCRTYDISVPCKYMPHGKKKYGVLCVFDNTRWIPIWYGPIKNGRMKFEKICGDVAYMAGYYSNETRSVMAASDPFILDSLGMIHYLEGKLDESHSHNMVLKRKFPRLPKMDKFASRLLRSVFEGANKPDFSDATLLHVVTKLPIDVTWISLPQQHSYRYYRWRVPEEEIGDLAELTLFGKAESEQECRKIEGIVTGYLAPRDGDLHPFGLAMDDDPQTYYSKPQGAYDYISIDARQKTQVERIRYSPRSDTNYIEEGDLYELFMMHDGQWLSLGKQIADCDSLIFKTSATDALYWLRDLTKGREERIFTIDQGKQIWW